MDGGGCRAGHPGVGAGTVEAGRGPRRARSVGTGVLCVGGYGRPGARPAFRPLPERTVTVTVAARHAILAQTTPVRAMRPPPASVGAPRHRIEQQHHTGQTATHGTDSHTRGSAARPREPPRYCQRRQLCVSRAQETATRDKQPHRDGQPHGTDSHTRDCLQGATVVPGSPEGRRRVCSLADAEASPMVAREDCGCSQGAMSRRADSHARGSAARRREPPRYCQRRQLCVAGDSHTGQTATQGQTATRDRQPHTGLPPRSHRGTGLARESAASVLPC